MHLRFLNITECLRVFAYDNITTPYLRMSADDVILFWPSCDGIIV